MRVASRLSNTHTVISLKSYRGVVKCQSCLVPQCFEGAASVAARRSARCGHSRPSGSTVPSKCSRE
ncbi:hypothetical protein E2C01_023032 [Portunus trituberculatus]|uniref:Uncharacterized protein n=1 Tax=Portunus trituberculatus TaxID=210409 RepID=A0A5B7EA37_PORTR|nr:hypothetical protein [Portunus trituberculatus]